jgi:uncharacterized protein YndB with AHSA1/START domain
VGRSIAFATFVIERTYDATLARTFKAWIDPVAKARWFGAPGEWKQIERSLDFRIGGIERLVGEFPGGRTSAFTARYLDIVPDQRIVYVYDMHLNGTFISSSLATVEFTLAGKGTHLRFTEQAAFVDGYDDNGSRERGTTLLLEQFGRYLQDSIH